MYDNCLKDVCFGGWFFCFVFALTVNNFWSREMVCAKPECANLRYLINWTGCILWMKRSFKKVLISIVHFPVAQLVLIMLSGSVTCMWRLRKLNDVAFWQILFKFFFFVSLTRTFPSRLSSTLKHTQTDWSGVSVKNKLFSNIGVHFLFFTFFVCFFFTHYLFLW